MWKTRILSVEGKRKTYTVGEDNVSFIGTEEVEWAKLGSREDWFRVEMMDGRADTLLNPRAVISVRLATTEGHEEED